MDFAKPFAASTRDHCRSFAPGAGTGRNFGVPSGFVCLVLSGLVLATAEQAVATSGRLSLEAASPPIPAVAREWDDYFLCQGNLRFSTAEALYACIEEDFTPGQPCLGPNLTPGPWEDVPGQVIMGHVSEQKQIIQIEVGDVDDIPGQGPTCTVLKTSTPVYRRRSVDCDDAGPGYVPSVKGCVNSARAYIQAEPPVCLDVSGDSPSNEGNPCDAATGDKWQREVDYKSPTLSFERHYHSLAPLGYAGLGVGWTHSYSARLLIVGGRARAAIRATGHAEPLERVDRDNYPDYYFSVTGSGLIAEDAGSEWIVHLPAGQREIYSDPDGRLLRLVEVSGETTALQYNSAGRLASVVGPYGHALTLTYDSLGYFLQTVRDPAGREITYTTEGENLRFVRYQDHTEREYRYDKEGFPHHLTAVIDENGDTFARFDYDAFGRAILSEHSGGVGRVRLDYAADGSTVVTDADGHQKIYEFSDNPDQWLYRWNGTSYNTIPGALQAARSASPQAWNLQLSGIPTFIVDPPGSQPHRKVLALAVDGRARYYESVPGDYARRPGLVTHENGVQTRYQYDLFHRIETIEAFNEGSDRRATVFEYLEPTSNLPLNVKSPSVDGVHQRAVKTRYCEPVTSRCPNARLRKSVSITGYGPDGAPTQGRVTTYRYHENGQLAEINGPRTDVSDTLRLTYYATDEQGADCEVSGGGRCGQLQSISNALGHQATIDNYYPDGRPAQLSDANGLVTEYTYTPRGFLDTVTQRAGSKTRSVDYDYDAVGHLERLTRPNGFVLTYAWSAAHLLASVTDNAGNRIQYSYDNRGNRTGAAFLSSGGATRRSLTAAYDARGNRELLQDGANAPARWQFDSLGNLTESWDPNGRATRYEYDALNRLRVVVDALNGASAPTTYRYDLNDKLTEIRAPNGAVTEYAYDDLGNLLQEKSPDRGLTLYAYDRAGNLTCKADGRYSATYANCSDAPQRWVYGYDALNRVATIDFLVASGSFQGGHPGLSFYYDGPAEIGRLNMVSHLPDGEELVDTHFDYDLFGNLTSKRQSVPGSPVAPGLYVTSYRHDASGEVDTVIYPSGRRVEYDRDEVGRINQVRMTSPVDQQETVLVSNVFYEPFGPLSYAYLGNGLISGQIYDQAYRPRYTFLADFGGAWDYHELVRDAAGNLEQDIDLLDPANTRRYEYDRLDRLIDDSFIDADPTLRTYSYDGNGNRLERVVTAPGLSPQTLVYDTANDRPNRIASVNGRPVVYDGAGNVLANGAGVSLTYGAGNRLAGIRAGGDYLTAIYNGLGELARTSTVPACPCGGCASWKEYFHFGADGRALGLVQQSNRGTRIEWDWVWLGDRPVAQIQESYAADGTHVGTEITYLHTDGLGTPRMGTNESGTVTWRYDSDGFGNGNTAGSATVRLRFPGQIDYGVGGLSYNYYRDYDPDTGRYLQSDPIGLTGGLNTYLYAHGNPLRYSDPDGLLGLGFRDRVRDFWTRPGGPFGKTCGAEGDPRSGWIPDGIYGPACKWHDACYGDCAGPSKLSCDLFFGAMSSWFYFMGVQTPTADKAFERARTDCPETSCAGD